MRSGKRKTNEGGKDHTGCDVKFNRLEYLIIAVFCFIVILNILFYITGLIVVIFSLVKLTKNINIIYMTIIAV